MDVRNWRKASFSSGNGGACIEVADTGDGVAVRDSKQNKRGPVLGFPVDVWRKFTIKLK